jgi:hypothetical protein
MPDMERKKHLQPWSAAVYRIEIEGLLEKPWSDHFAGMRITHRKRADQSTITCLKGRLLDQCQLAGVLSGLTEMHLPILSVENLNKPDYVREKTESDSSPPTKPEGTGPGK